MRSAFAALIFLTAAAASAGCDRPDAAPIVPNGATSDEEVMKAGREAIQAYVVQLEAYQACLKKQVDEAPANTSAQIKMTWMAQGDAAIDAANILANRYSAALKTFKAREAAAATTGK